MIHNMQGKTFYIVLLLLHVLVITHQVILLVIGDLQSLDDRRTLGIMWSWGNGVRDLLLAECLAGRKAPLNNSVSDGHAHRPLLLPTASQ